MAPREKVLCACCGVRMFHQREREHRRAANSQPYPAPTGMYQSKQRRIFGPVSEPSEPSEHESESYGIEAGPSRTSSSEMDSQDLPDSDLELDEQNDTDIGFELTADTELGGAAGNGEGSEDIDAALHVEGLVAPGFIMQEHWKDGNSRFRPNVGGEDIDSDDDFEEGTDSGEELRDEDSEAENSADDPDIFDWDQFEAPG
ncbi:hypothetical protein B0H13DRAFT_2377466 [Mycena leptocephala]|nr:hypothetical protein B0H13DRAFT_2377466 [Mycena leptocephala]